MKFNFKGLLIFAFSLLVTCKITQAQSVEVKGTVTLAKTKEELGGVTVVELNQNDRQVNGTNTDKDGNYKLRISNPANKLQFSFIGFESRNESINGRSIINVQLVPDTGKNRMTDVIIVGKKRNR